MSPSSIGRLGLTPRFLRVFFLWAMVVNGHAIDISVVYPVVLESRSADGTAAIKINEQITVNLAPSQVFPSTFVLSTSTGENVTHEEFDTSNISEHIYQDENSMTAVSMRDVNGAVEMNGIINDTFGIEPLPILEHNIDGRIPHRLFRRTSAIGGGHAGVSARSFSKARSGKKFIRYSNAASPEVYVLCDSVFSQAFETDYKMITYLAVILVSVNLRYKSINGYEIKFQFVGLMKLNAELEAEFLVMYGQYMDGQSTLLMLQMFARRLGLQKADVRYLVTSRDLIAPHGKKIDPSMAGLAYVGGLCSLDGVAIGEEKPGLYSGVEIMTHELAHLLGCVHDGEGAVTRIPGHKGSTSPECAARLGFLMSYHNEDKANRYTFSPCCIAQMKLFLAIVSDECIMNTFNVTQTIPKSRFFPGHFMTPYNFCLKRQPKLALASIRTMTADAHCKLKCEYGRYKTQFTYNALDGMTCGVYKTCYNGICA